jgi:hypothetical protein
VTAAHVGREFDCKKCGAKLVVREDGLYLVQPLASAPPPPPPVVPEAPPSPFGDLTVPAPDAGAVEEVDEPTVSLSRKKTTKRRPAPAAAKARARSGGGGGGLFWAGGGVAALGGIAAIVLAALGDKTARFSGLAAGAGAAVGGILLALAGSQLAAALAAAQKELRDLKHPGGEAE